MAGPSATFPGDSRTYPSEIPNLLLEVARKRPASCMHKKPAAAAPPPGPVRKAKTRATGGRPPAAPLEGVAQGQQKDRACAAPRAKKPAPSSNKAKSSTKNGQQKRLLASVPQYALDVQTGRDARGGGEGARQESWQGCGRGHAGRFAR